ncbi:DUF2207 domain-containing protein [Lacticigenium naphthae]|uniref:DUF2207 domain-containing protein n=1 Tax=Lacticigenium naphthae TaxID=515351 RepID=UPI000425F3C5|nr:DUF2207 domain-containing protein [Lacticigenium naphthae]
MKRYIKQLTALSVLTFVGLGWTDTVSAENELTSIEIDVQLQRDGSAIITENRDMNMDDGTELYITLEEMQDSELLDFSVVGFEEDTDWDLDASREEKAGKYGVVETDDGQELVWGIGEYGQNNYELSYTLSNLVRELDDGQALLWNFDTFSSIPADNLTVTISGHEPFTQEDVRFWGFGLEGDIQLIDEEIVWQASEVVDSSNDVTVLAQFPEGFFNAQVYVDSTLEEQREMAMEGSAYNEETSSDTILIILFTVLGITAGGAGLAAILYSRKLSQAKADAGQMLTGTKRVQKNKGFVYETIPFEEEDLAGIAFVLQEFQKGYFEDYFTAYLLKWVEEDRISMDTTVKKVFFSNQYETLIQIKQFAEEKQKHPYSFTEFASGFKPNQGDTYEKGLWVMLLDAADASGKVDNDHIQHWAKKNAKAVEKFADALIEYSKDYLERKNLITFKEIKVWGSKQEVTVASAEGEQLLDRVVQFDNYLKQTDIKEAKRPNSPIDFSDYLIWSILYFRKDDITKQLDSMVPEPTQYYDNSLVGPYYWYWYGTTGMRNNWSTGLSYGGFHSKASSAASGMGGATGIGGGGGAGGGGGGGAR